MMTNRIDTDLIHHEIQSLELLSRQLFMELDDLQAERDRLRYAKTWRGKYFNVLGRSTFNLL